MPSPKFWPILCAHTAQTRIWFLVHDVLFILSIPGVFLRSICTLYFQVISYMRGPFLFTFNFHPTNAYERYNVGVEEAGEYQVSVSVLSIVLLFRSPNSWLYIVYHCDLDIWLWIQRFRVSKTPAHNLRQWTIL